MLIVLVFAAIFISAALLMFAVTSRRAEEKKKTLSRFDEYAVRSADSDVKAAPSVVREEEVFSEIPWLDLLLRKADVAQRVRLLLYQADLKWTVAKLLLGSLLLASVSAVLIHWRTGAWPPSVLLGAFCGAVPFAFVLYKRARRFEGIRQLLPDALEMMVAVIRAGHSLMSAMGQAAKETPDPLRRELRQCFEEQNFGLDLRLAMANLAYRVPLPETRVISAAVLIQRDTGGNLTEILEKVAHLIREEYKLRRQVRIHTAQGRLTGWILSLLPVFLGVVIYVMNPAHMRLLWTRPMGLKMLYGGAILEALGVFVILKIVRVRI